MCKVCKEHWSHVNMSIITFACNAYTCTLTLNYPWSLLVIVWWLLVPINISGIRGEPTVLEGDNLQLICEASSQLEPNIIWTKEKPGNLQGNTVVLQEEKMLNITNINRTDAGNYTCTAYNGFGKQESRTVYVNVTCEYGFLFTTFNLMCCN